VNVKLPLKKKLWILNEIQIGRDHIAKAIAKRHAIHQSTVYKIWRQREAIRGKR
jgi:hypothetical protein